MDPVLKDPQRDATILKARVRGHSIREAAEVAVCSESTVKRVTAQHKEWVEEQRELIQQHILNNIEGPIDARLADAANEESRTGANSMRVLAENFLGWGLRSQAMLVQGDLNLSVDLSDQRSAAVHLMDSKARQERIAELDEELGLG